MSHQISQSRLSYSRQFLIQYQHIYKPDQTITDKLSPHLSSSRSLNTSKKIPNPRDSISRSARTPHPKKNSSAYLQRSEKKQNSYKIRNENTSNNHVAPQNPDLTNPIENTELENAMFCRRRVDFSLSLPDIEPLRPSKSETSPSPPDTPPIGSLSHSQSDTSVPLGIVPFDMALHSFHSSTPNSVFLSESKFAALFSKSPVDNGSDHTDHNSDFCDSSPRPIPNNSLSSSFEFQSPESLPIPKFTETTSPTTDAPTNTVQQASSLALSPLPKSKSVTQDRSSWVAVEQKGTPRTPVYIKSPEVSKQETSPYRVSRTPKSAHGSRPISPLDEQRLIQRQKQIDYGYRTVGYLRYRLLVPKDKRKPEHPRTPKKAQGCSKRSWDGQLKKWRRDLHLWDPDKLDAFRALLNSDLVETIITANPELAEIVHVVREKLDNPLANDDESEEEESSPIGSSLKGVEKKKQSGEPRLEKVARTLVF
jgi:hypothetical protein